MGDQEAENGDQTENNGGKPVTHIEREHGSNGARRRELAATDTIIACFLSQKNMFRSCFFYRPRMKLVS